MKTPRCLELPQQYWSRRRPKGWHWQTNWYEHHKDVIISAMASQITSLTIVYSTIYSGADQGKHQSSASLSFVRGIHRWPVNSPHKGQVTRKMFPFYDVIMVCQLMKNSMHGVYQAYIWAARALYTIATLSMPNLPKVIPDPVVTERTGNGLLA